MRNVLMFLLIETVLSQSLDPQTQPEEYRYLSLYDGTPLKGMFDITVGGKKYQIKTKETSCASTGPDDPYDFLPILADIDMPSPPDPTLDNGHNLCIAIWDQTRCEPGTGSKRDCTRKDWVGLSGNWWDEALTTSVNSWAPRGCFYDVRNSYYGGTVYSGTGTQSLVSNTVGWWLYCIEPNPVFQEITCETHPCPYGYIDTSIECNNFCDDATCCTPYDELPPCGENEHVVDHGCVACPAGKHKAAGDLRGSDTECWDDSTCGGLTCSTNTLTCENHSCKCKPGYHGLRCEAQMFIYNAETNPEVYKYLSLYDGTPGKGVFNISVGDSEYQIKTKFVSCESTGPSDPYDLISITDDLTSPSGLDICQSIWDQTRCTSGSGGDCAKDSWVQGFWWTTLNVQIRGCWLDSRGGYYGGQVYSGHLDKSTVNTLYHHILLYCIEPNPRLDKLTCKNHLCTYGTRDATVECGDACSDELCCLTVDDVEPCGENEHVVNNYCTACPAGKFRPAGDIRDRETECWNEGTCGGVACVEANTESCVQHTCVCKPGFHGASCAHTTFTYDPITQPKKFRYMSLYDGSPGKGAFTVTVGGTEYQIKTKFDQCAKRTPGDPYDLLPITSDIEMPSPPDPSKSNGENLCLAIWDQTRCISGSGDCRRDDWVVGIWYDEYAWDRYPRGCWSENRVRHMGSIVFSEAPDHPLTNDINYKIIYCVEPNPTPLESLKCGAGHLCPFGFIDENIECNGLCDDATCCIPLDELPPCGENEHVVDHVCEACPAGKHKAAGDKRGSDTECWDDGTCGGVMCVEANTESCDTHSCMCKPGFQGLTCDVVEATFDPETQPDAYKYMSIYDGTPGKGEFILTVGDTEYQIKTKYYSCAKSNIMDPYDFLPILPDIEMLSPDESMTNGQNLCQGIHSQTRTGWGSGNWYKMDYWPPRGCWSDTRNFYLGNVVYSGDGDRSLKSTTTYAIQYCIDPIIPETCENFDCPRWYLNKEGECGDDCTISGCCTALASLPPCGENEHSVNHECVQCPEGKHKKAGDLRTRDTECWDNDSCGGDFCVEQNTENCVNYACVCKAGFGGTICDKDTSPKGLQDLLKKARKKALPTEEDIIERQNVIKEFARDTLKQKLKEGADLKSAISETKIQVTPEDLPRKAQTIMKQIAKPPAIAVAPPNADIQDTCSQGADSPGCGMVDIESDSNETVILTTDPEPGSWTVMSSKGTVVSKQTRISEFVYKMQCWGGDGWVRDTIVNVTDGASLYECNGNVLMVASQTGICSNSTCSNGGECVADGSSYVCNCKMGWTGRHCQEVDTSSYCFQFSCNNYGGHKILGPCGDSCSASACCVFANQTAFNDVCSSTKDVQTYVRLKCCHRDLCND